MNHLEALTAEFLELSGYFVRKNVQVAPRPRGGYDGELVRPRQTLHTLAEQSGSKVGSPG